MKNENMETKGASKSENTYNQIECHTLEQYGSPKLTNESTQTEKKKQTAKQHPSCCKAAFLATVIAVQAFLLAIVAVTITVIAFRNNMNEVVPSQLSSSKQMDIDGLWSQFNKCNSTNGKNYEHSNLESFSLKLRNKTLLLHLLPFNK